MLRFSGIGCCMAAFAAALLAVQPGYVSAAGVSYSTSGSVYSQDFNSLPTTPVDASLQSSIPWADDTTSTATRTSIPGWYLYHPIIQTTEGGTNTHQRLRIGAGAGNTGAFMSYGPAANTDRALGALNSDTMSTPQNAAVPPATQEESQMYIGLLLTNDTGQTLNSFSLAYIGEQWRKAGNGTGGTQVTDDATQFQYSLDPLATINSPNAMYTHVSALDFASPVTTGAAGTLDGNAAANRASLSATINDITWAPGASLWLRWVDINYPGPNPSAGTTRGDNGLAIDDLNFSATGPVPEPSALVLLGLGGMVFYAGRSRLQNAK